MGDNILLAYFLFIFVSFLGMMQIAVTYAQLRGLSFFRRPLWSYTLGALLIIGSFIWFFSSGDRAQPTRLEGGGQFALFFGGMVAAFIVTAVISSVIHHRTCSHVQGRGLEALKDATYFKIIATRFRSKK